MIKMEEYREKREQLDVCLSLWYVLGVKHVNMLFKRYVSLYLQDVSQVGSADLRVVCGVERDRGYPDKGKDAGFGVPPQHHPRALLRLAVEHHLMGSWQSLGSCKKIYYNIRITSLYYVNDLKARLMLCFTGRHKRGKIWLGAKKMRRGE